MGLSLRYSGAAVCMEIFFDSASMLACFFSNISFSFLYSPLHLSQASISSLSMDICHKTRLGRLPSPQQLDSRSTRRTVVVELKLEPVLVSGAVNNAEWIPWSESTNSRSQMRDTQPTIVLRVRLPTLRGISAYCRTFITTCSVQRRCSLGWQALAYTPATPSATAALKAAGRPSWLHQIPRGS